MSKFINKKILVIGDVMLDHYINGSCNRISPEAPVQVVDFENEQWLLGGAANVANNLIEFGSGVVLCGVIGLDEYSHVFEDLLNQRGIENLLIKSASRITTVKSRVISNGHQLLRIDKEVKFDISEDEAQIIYKNIEFSIQDYSVIVISDYAKGFLNDSLTRRIIKLANQYDIPTLIDPKTPPFSKYQDSTVIKPNKKEAFAATGINITDKHTLKSVCAEIQRTTKSKAVVVTLSEEGVGVFANEKLVLLPTRAKEVFDVTGAGDTFLAAIAFQLSNSMDIFQACEFANYASGVVVGKQGCATVSLNEVKSLIENIQDERVKSY